MNAAQMVETILRSRPAPVRLVSRQPPAPGTSASADRGSLRRPLELYLSIAASVLAALIVAAVGLALPGPPAPAEVDEPVQIRAIESDLAEPFVVCATRAGVTRCQERDLRSDP